MDYNIFYNDRTNLKNIKCGKPQVFNANKYIPIYYNENGDKKTKYNDFLIKSPRLFIPNKPRREMGFKPSIETIFIKGDDDGVSQFESIIEKIEAKLKRQISKWKKVNVKDKEYVPLLRCDSKYKTGKMYIPLSIFTSSCIDINNKQINEWDFVTPTYGYFIIQIKNVWVNNNKWGINMFCNGAMILPSQLMDPPPIPIQEIKYMFESELDELNCVGDSEIYGKFFKMKKMQVPIQAIKNKMELEGLDGSIIELNATTPLSKIPKTSPSNCVPLPPPPPPPPLINGLNCLNLRPLSKISINSSSSVNSPESARNALFAELLSKKGSMLKKNNNNNNTISNKIVPNNIKNDVRVPSLDQIKDAIHKMKMASNC